MNYNQDAMDYNKDTFGVTHGMRLLLARRGCVLCAAAPTEPVTTGDGKTYHFCPACGLYYLDPAFHLTPEREAARYRQHRNMPDDEHYTGYLLKFLKTAFLPYFPGHQNPNPEQAPASASAEKPRILDFGAGEHQAATRLLRSLGFEVTPYDPAFIIPREWNNRQYDGIICIEVLEHLRNPADTITQLAALLRPGGTLAVQTLLHGHTLKRRGLISGYQHPEPGHSPGVYIHPQNSSQTKNPPISREESNMHAFFETWWYREDATHTAFFSEQTMGVIAKLSGLELASVTEGKNVAFRKNVEEDNADCCNATVHIKDEDTSSKV